MRVWLYAQLFAAMAFATHAQDSASGDGNGDDDEGPPSFEIGSAYDDIFSVEASCDRLESRVVRQILHDDVFPVIEHAGLVFPKACPFHESNDRLAVHEENKKYVRSTGWRCKYCNKMFKSEKWMDVHMANRHLDKMDPNAKVCLGRFCDMFHCRDHSLYTAKPKGSRTEERRVRAEERKSKGSKNPRGEHCSPHRMARAKYVCLATLQRCLPDGNEPHSQTDSAAASSSPSSHAGSTDRAHAVLEALSARYCDPLSCDAAAGADVHGDEGEERLGVRLEAAGAATAAASLKMASRGETTKRRLYYIGLGFLVLILVVFYLGVWVYRRDLSVKSDLRRLDGRRRGEALMFWRKRKEKGY